jgi:glycolate oxidase FAD binding subunit
MDHRGLLGTKGEPTIGGVVAANVSGPRRIAVGACRDFLLGVRFVDGMGRVLKNGGRVMKNVTGYDLVKLLAGSRGTLGVLSEVSFKVLPRPDTVATLIWYGLGWTAAARLFADALGSPYEVTGAARLPGDNEGGQSKVLIRIEGFEKSVTYRAEQLVSVSTTVGKPDHIETNPAQNRALWEAVRDVAPFHGKEGAVWRSSVKPSDMIAVTGDWEAKHVADWGGGLIWTQTDEARDVRARLLGIGGHATLIRASDAAKERFGVFQPEPVAIQKISQGLRDKFDPRGILNPGLMG